MSKRTESIGQIVQRALSPLLLEYEPHYGIISVTQVDVQPDLKQAFVYLSSEKYTEQLVRVLQKKARHFQREIQGVLLQKIKPQLTFRIDLGQVHAKSMEDLF